MFGTVQMGRQREATAVFTAHNTTALLGALAIVMALALARPGFARGQGPPAVSAWTVEACRMEIERRGWRITANESPETPNADGWVWFRLATEPERTSDALCAEGPHGGVSLNVLSTVDGGDPSPGDAGGDLVAFCGAELVQRGWTRAGGASMARTGTSILVQHVIRNASGGEGVGHCVYERGEAASIEGEGKQETSSPALISVSADLVRPSRGIDVACREAFQVLGWTATTIPSAGRGDRLAHYNVTGRRGKAQRVICRYDSVGETVQIEVEK
jgi:hypothetical protein